MSEILVLLFLNFLAISIYLKFNLKPVTSFLTSIFIGITFLTFSAFINQIFISTILFFTFSTCTFLYTMYKNKNIKNYFTPILNLVLITCFIFLIILKVQDPLFYYWDEYSFWGTSAKILKETNMLYIYMPNVLASFRFVPCASSVLSYLFQFFNPEFFDYTMLFAYATLFFTVCGSICEYIYEKTNKQYVSVLFFIILILTPFLQGYHLPSLDFTSASYAYASVMVDFLVAAMALGCLFIYLNAPKYKFYLIGLFALVLTKDIGLVMGVLAICVIACFELFGSDKKSLIRITNIALAIVVVLSSYIMWNMVSSYANSNLINNHTPISTTLNKSNLTYYNAFEGNVDVLTDEPDIAEEASPAQEEFADNNNKTSILSFLFNKSSRTDRQNEVVADMWLQFKTNHTIIGISDIFLILILILLGAITVIFANKNHKVIFAFINGGLFAGWALYMTFLSYFISNFGDGMVEYSRYLTTYYWFWIYATLALCVTIIYKKKLLTNIILFFILIFTLFNISKLKLEHTIIDTPDNPYYTIREKKNYIDSKKAILNENSNVLVIGNRFNDYYLMVTTKLLLPSQTNWDRNYTGIDFSMGFSKEEFVEDDVINYYNIVTDEELITLVKENFDYLYLAHLQPEFTNSYSHLFIDEPMVDTFYTVNENNMFEVVK